MEWRPIETAPKDGTVILVCNDHGTWAARYVDVYQSGYVPEHKWHSLMLNHKHMIGPYPSLIPTHWQPLPTPPTE